MQNKFILTDGLKHADLLSDDPTIWNLFGVPRNTDDIKLYSCVAAAYRAYNLKANTVGSMPFCLYKQGVKEGGKVKATGYTEVDDTAEGDEFDNSATWQNKAGFLPNPFELLRINTLSYIATNTIYVLRTSDVLGHKTKGLYPAIPYNFEPRLNGRQTSVEYIERKVGTGIERYTFPDDKRLVRLWRLDHTTELLPSRNTEAQAILNAAGIVHNEQFWIKHFYETGAIPPTIVAMKGALSPDKQAAEQKSWRDWFMRLGKFLGQPVRTINGELLEVKQMGSSIADLSKNEVHNQSLADIAAGLGMPLSLLLANSANYATAKEERALWFDSDIIPFCKWLEYEYNRQVWNPIGLYMEFHPETLDPQQEDETERAQAMAQYASVLEKCPSKEVFMGLAATLGLEIAPELEAALDAYYTEKKQKEEEMRAQMERGGYTVGPDGKPLPAQVQPKEDPKREEKEEKDEEKKPARGFPAKWTPSLDEFKEIDWWRTIAFRKHKRNESLSFDYLPRHGGLPEDVTKGIAAKLAAAQSEDDINAAFVLEDVPAPAREAEPESDIKALAASLNKLADGLFTQKATGGINNG